MKSFATSICPIKNPLAVNMRHWVAAPVWRDHHPTDLKTVSFRCHNRSSARRPSLQMPQWHPRIIPAPSPRHPRAIPASSPPGKSVFYRMLADSGPFSWTSRCSLGAPVGLRHGDLAYRCFRAISAWRSSHLSALRHGAPSHNHLSGIPAWRTASRPVHDRQLTDALTGLWHGTPGHRWF